MSFDVLFNQFMSGIARAAMLFLVASGLSLTFGVLRILNFAHGSFYMLGGFSLLQHLENSSSCLFSASILHNYRCLDHWGQ